MELITERLNAVVDALEQSLTDKPDKGELSRIARCSYSDLNSLFLQLTRRPEHGINSQMQTWKSSTTTRNFHFDFSLSR